MIARLATAAGVLLAALSPGGQAHAERLIVSVSNHRVTVTLHPQVRQLPERPLDGVRQRALVAADARNID